MSEQYQKVAAHGFIKKEGKCLITKRSAINDHMPNLWDIAGGSIEFGEDPKEGLKREIHEETGLEVSVGNPIFVFAYLSGAQRHQFQIVYECNYLGGDVVLNPEEHDEFRWIEPSELKDLPKIAFLEEFSKQINN